MPTHQRATLLERCLAALAAQTFGEFEAVVAVDGSTDGTVALLTALERRHAWLRWAALPHRGRARARNAAMRAARGAVAVFCDDDVVLDPETLARHAAFHELHERSVAVGPLRFPDDSTRWSPRPGWVNLSGANASAPLDELLAAGGFDEGLLGYGGEDLELGLRLARAGLRFRPLPGAGAEHLGPRVAGPDKAREAGRQAYRLFVRYGREVGLQLGVHPSLLAAKRAYLNPLLDRVAGRNPNYAYERAYLEGAHEVRAEHERHAVPPEEAQT